MTYPPTFDLTFTASPGFGRHCNACGTGPGVVRCSAALSPKADIVIYLCDDCAEPRITNTTGKEPSSDSPEETVAFRRQRNRGMSRLCATIGGAATR